METAEKELLTYDNFFIRYRLRLGDLTSVGKREAAERGSLPGPVPLGYLNRRTGRFETSVVPDPMAASLVREAFELAAQGWTVRRLATEMGERGLRSRSGNPVRPSALWHLLTNPFYAGTVRYLGQAFPGRHEPLVGKDLFARVQEELRGRGKKSDERPISQSRPT